MASFTAVSVMCSILVRSRGRLISNEITSMLFQNLYCENSTSTGRFNIYDLRESIGSFPEHG